MREKIIVLFGLFAFLGLFAQKTYTVSKGDNPYNISKKYGITSDDLLKMNPKIKDGKLAIGDVLVVSGKGKNIQTTVLTPVKPGAVVNSGKTGTILLKPKQTIYSITKQYHIMETDLRKLNPNLDQNMKIGDAVTLPWENLTKYGVANEISQSNSSNTDATTKEMVQAANSDSVNATVATKTNMQTKVVDDFVTYTVIDGDTIFGIVNKFGVSLDELLALNPNLAAGLKVGMILKIKKIEPAYSKKSGEGLNIVFLLPFDFDNQDSKYKTMSFDFLSGAKLAIERNVKLGKPMNIKVIDTGSEVNFKKSLAQINKDNTDLIVGPFFKSNVLETLNYLSGKKIPVVAPFANSEDLYDFDQLIISEINDGAYADRIVKEVKDIFSDQKIYIVKDRDQSISNYIKTSLEKTLKNPTIILVNSANDIVLDKNMMTGQSAPIIAILATDNVTEAGVFANKMIAFSKEVQNIKAFSIAFSPIFEKNVQELRQVNLVYLMDRKINADGDFEKEILADFKQKYCKLPGKYAVIGFDIVNDLLTRENKKGEIFKQISTVQTQLATKFEYVRAKSNGAYINIGYRVVRLVP